MEKQTSKKRNYIFTVIILTAIIAAAAVWYLISEKTVKIKNLSSENLVLNELVEKRDSVVNDMVTTFNEIEDNLELIRQKRNQLTLMNEEGSSDQKEAILTTINEVNAMLDQSDQQIAALEKKIQQAGLQINSFKAKIAGMSKTIDEQNRELLALQKEIEARDVEIREINEKVVVLEEVLASAQDSLRQKDDLINKNELLLNKGFLALGTEKELEEFGLIQKKGGFLWLGRTKALKEDFDENYFTEVDIRKTDHIDLNSRGAKIISEHPDSSYQFVVKDGLVAALEIKDPEAFWKISKYALIEIQD